MQQAANLNKIIFIAVCGERKFVFDISFKFHLFLNIFSGIISPLHRIMITFFVLSYLILISKDVVLQNDVIAPIEWWDEQGSTCQIILAYIEVV